MKQFITRYLDRIYDNLNHTETARAWGGDRCIACLRLPKGFADAIEELTEVLNDNSPDEVEFFADYDDEILYYFWDASAEMWSVIWDSNFQSGEIEESFFDLVELKFHFPNAIELPEDHCPED